MALPGGARRGGAPRHHAARRARTGACTRSGGAEPRRVRCATLSPTRRRGAAGGLVHRERRRRRRRHHGAVRVGVRAAPPRRRRHAPGGVRDRRRALDPALGAGLAQQRGARHLAERRCCSPPRAFGGMLFVRAGDVGAHHRACWSSRAARWAAATCCRRRSWPISSTPTRSRPASARRASTRPRMMFALKIGISLATAASGVVLSAAGFVPNVEQSAESLLGIRMLFAGLPCAGLPGRRSAVPPLPPRRSGSRRGTGGRRGAASYVLTHSRSATPTSARRPS